MLVEDYIQAGLTHSLHTSARKSFRGCRRRWSWIFQDFYYPPITAKPLEFGIAYHKALEVYYNPETWKLVRAGGIYQESVANAAIMAFKEIGESQFKEYLKFDPEPDSSVEEDYKERFELGLGMLKYHLLQLAPKLDENLTPLKVEIPFEVPIVDPQSQMQLWCKCNVCWDRWLVHLGKPWADPTSTPIENLREVDPSYRTKGWMGLPVTLGGRIDCLMEDELGRLWVFDWKTAARLSDRQDFLLTEDQITSYLWAMWTLGIDAVGFIYHEQKKAFPVEPEPNKTIRLGRRFSVNKQQDTTYDLYKRTVRENDTSAYEEGLYDEFLDYLRESEVEEGVMTRNNFFARYSVPRNENELTAAGQHIYDEACDMTNIHLRIYPQPGRFTCGNCAFQVPCVGKNRGEDYQYALDTLFEKRSYHYWEDRPLSTENEGRTLGA